MKCKYLLLASLYACVSIWVSGQSFAALKRHDVGKYNKKLDELISANDAISLKAYIASDASVVNQSSNAKKPLFMTL